MKLLAVLALVILAGIYYYVALPALNIHSTEFWIFLIVVIVAAAFLCEKKAVRQICAERIQGDESDPGDSWRSCNRVCSRYTVVFSDRQREKISEADESRGWRIYKRYRGTLI